MTWAAPWALGLAVAVLLPLVAHLWSRRQPVVQPISTLRFLRASSPVSRRLQRVQDWPLLILRCAIVVVIASAVAGPTLATAMRVDAWKARLHRVIVVETSVAAAAGPQVAAWQREATSSDVLTGPAPMGALPDAIARARAAAVDTRAEIVVIWSGRKTSLPPRAIADIPAEVGLTLAPLPAAPVATGLGAPLVVEALPVDASVASRLGDIATAAPRRSDLVVRLHLPGVALPSAQTEVADREARALLDALAADPRVRQAAERSPADPRASALTSGNLRTLAVDGDGRPLLAGRAAGRRVDLALAAAPGSPLALWTVTSVRDALERRELADASNQWSPQDITRAQREGRPPTSPRLPAGLDTRACWAMALLLLIVEQGWRRRRYSGADDEVRDAA